jgi:hypothetical protein
MTRTQRDKPAADLPAANWTVPNGTCSEEVVREVDVDENGDILCCGFDPAAQGKQDSPSAVRRNATSGRRVTAHQTTQDPASGPAGGVLAPGGPRILSGSTHCEARRPLRHATPAAQSCPTRSGRAR